MKLQKQTGLFFFFSLLAFLFLFSAASFRAEAATTDNVGGYAWSSNIGWIKLNNCTTPNDPATCVGNPTSGYGVKILGTVPGTMSGYAWSSNIGWISFDAGSVAGCPAGFSQCGAMVEWGVPAGGPYKMKGWARACSAARNPATCNGVFTSAEVTSATNPANSTTPLALEYATWLARTGGWDGFIALGIPSTAVASNWPPEGGVNITVDNKITGFAWGSEVIGWVNFSYATLPPPPITQCSDNIDNADTEDTLVDEADPGCHTDGNAANAASYDWTDDDETNTSGEVCNNGIDDDGDGQVDENCGGSEPCDGIDNNGNGQVDEGCPGGPDDPDDPEGNGGPQCSDGIDNADPEDTLVDALDPGCWTNPTDPATYDPDDDNEQNKRIIKYIEF